MAQLMFLAGLDLTQFGDEGLNLQHPRCHPGSTLNPFTKGLSCFAADGCFILHYFPAPCLVPAILRSTISRNSSGSNAKSLSETCLSGEERKVILPSSVGSAWKHLLGDS